MDHFAAMHPLCLEQGNCSLEGHLEQFLILAHQTTFPHDCLSTFLHVGLNTATNAQLSGESPRRSFMD